MAKSTQRKPSLSYRVAIVGAGKAGSAVARLLASAGCSTDCVISRTLRTARSLARELHAPVVSRQVRDIPATTNFVLIATNDAMIPEIAESLAKYKHLDFPRLTVMHLSGALTRETLAPLHLLGARTLSLHPAFPFSTRSVLPERLQHIRWGVECEQRNWTKAKTIVAAFGGVPVRLNPKNKIYYHAACTITSNFIGVLLDDAARLCEKADIPRAEAMMLLQPLLSETFDNLFTDMTKPMKQKLTGPAARGDMDTIARHREALNKFPDIEALYQALTDATIDMMKKNST